MVCMIADYKDKAGNDHNESLIAQNTDSPIIAIGAAYDNLKGRGFLVQCITVFFGEFTMDELDALSVAPDPGVAYMSFPFLGSMKERRIFA